MSKATILVVSKFADAAGALRNRLEGFDVRHVCDERAARALLAGDGAALVIYDEELGDPRALAATARGNDARFALLTDDAYADDNPAPAIYRISKPLDAHEVRRLLEHIHDVETAKRQHERSEAHSQAVANVSLEGMFTLNERGQIIASSRSASSLFGISPDELAGRDFTGLIATPDRAEWEACFRRMRRETAEDPHATVGDRREVFALRQDKEGVFPAMLSTSAVVDGDVHRFVAIVHDRTRERQLERRLHIAQEQERRRIGQELHDSVGGQLTGIEIASSLLHKKLQKEGSPHALAAGELVEHLRELHARVRDVSRGLLPVADDPLGLTTALRRLTKLSHGRGGTRCLFHCEEEVAVPDTGVATNLYHIAEEAVQNALRHADAGQIVIELSAPESDTIVLEVRDDGTGMPENAGVGNGIGIDSMAQRATLIGAYLNIMPAEPTGTRVRCTVDLSTSKGVSE